MIFLFVLFAQAFAENAALLRHRRTISSCCQTLQVSGDGLTDRGAGIYKDSQKNNKKLKLIFFLNNVTFQNFSTFNRLFLHHLPEKFNFKILKIRNFSSTMTNKNLSLERKMEKNLSIRHRPSLSNAL